MSITGALLGFAVAAIIVGIIGTIISGAMWGASDEWDDSHKSRKSLGFFVVLFFIGATIAGGLG